MDTRPARPIPLPTGSLPEENPYASTVGDRQVEDAVGVEVPNLHAARRADGVGGAGTERPIPDPARTLAGEDHDEVPVGHRHREIEDPVLVEIRDRERHRHAVDAVARGRPERAGADPAAAETRKDRDATGGLVRDQ